MATAPKTQRLEKTRKNCDLQITNPFAIPNAASDLILVVEDKNLHVSKLVLSLASPVFKLMFKAEFREKESNTISLPDKKFEDILEFLLCIYPSTNKPINAKTLSAVLPVAHEYQVQQLVDRCENYVLSCLHHETSGLRNPPIKELVHYLFLADTYDLPQLLKLCIEKMVLRNYQTGSPCAMDVDEFKLVSVKTRYEILEGRMKDLEPIAEKQTKDCQRQDFSKSFKFSY